MHYFLLSRNHENLFWRYKNENNQKVASLFEPPCNSHAGLSLTYSRLIVHVMMLGTLSKVPNFYMIDVAD